MVGADSSSDDGDYGVQVRRNGVVRGYSSSEDEPPSAATRAVSSGVNFLASLCICLCLTFLALFLAVYFDNPLWIVAMALVAAVVIVR